MRTHIIIALVAFVTLASVQPAPPSPHRADQTQAAGGSQQQS